MFNFLKKRQIKSTLIKGGKHVKVSISNVTREDTMIMLFLTIKEVAKFMRMDHRQLLNKLVDLNKTVDKAKKREEKENYKITHNNKK